MYASSLFWSHRHSQTEGDLWMEELWIRTEWRKGTKCHPVRVSLGSKGRRNPAWPKFPASQRRIIHGPGGPQGKNIDAGRMPPMSKGSPKNTTRVGASGPNWKTRRSQTIPSPRTGPKPRKRNSWLHGKLQDQHCRADGEKARTQEAHVKFQPDPLTECPTPPRPHGRTCYRPHWPRDCSC